MKRREGKKNYRIALFYEYGKAGLAQDYKQAMTWYKKIVSPRDGYIMYHIGRLYEEGKGIAPDIIEATKWYQKSADSDNGFGMYGIAHIHEKANESALALQWYQKAIAVSYTHLRAHETRHD